MVEDFQYLRHVMPDSWQISHVQSTFHTCQDTDIDRFGSLCNSSKDFNYCSEIRMKAIHFIHQRRAANACRFPARIRRADVSSHQKSTIPNRIACLTKPRPSLVT